MTSTVTNNVKAAALIALALAIGAMGIYVADADDAPGAAVIGLLLMIGAVVLGVKAARNRLPAWAARTALAVGVLVAAFAAFLTHAVAVTAPLFAQPQDVPSVMDSAAEWSPEHIGEPEENFPLFTIIRHVIFKADRLSPRAAIAWRSHDVLRPAI